MQNEEVQLNINFVLSGGKKPGAREALGAAVENVGFKAARNRQRRLKANLQRDFAPLVERELQDMAKKISVMAIGLANPNNPPPGVLRIDGPISAAMAGQAGPMTVASMTGLWAARTKPYMKWKLRKYRTRKWFKNTGELQRRLRSSGTYRSAYGPVSIKFTPTSLTGRTSGLSTLGRSSGGQSTNIMIGRLEVNPLRRITAGDLPGIGEVARYNARLMNPLADSIEKKLSGRKGKYRPVLEPFLTYYLTRRIPNAVYRKLEDSLT